MKIFEENIRVVHIPQRSIFPQITLLRKTIEGYVFCFDFIAKGRTTSRPIIFSTH